MGITTDQITGQEVKVVWNDSTKKILTAEFIESTPEFVVLRKDNNVLIIPHSSYRLMYREEKPDA